jgi:glutathione S-transferase
MITLFSFGPAFGLPDPNPFVMKTEILLKMANLPYRTDNSGFLAAPKGKLPYIDDDGEIVADSTFIRWHLEKKYGVDFDARLTAEQRAIAWALAEDHLYWALLDARWMDHANFAKGPAVFFFRSLPAPMRTLVGAIARRKVRRALYSHGMGAIPVQTL